MSDTPILSYKRGSRVNSPALSQESRVASPHIPSGSTGTDRKSLRRKALQEFYNIKNNEAENTNGKIEGSDHTGDVEKTTENEGAVDHDSKTTKKVPLLQSDQDFNTYIQNHSIEEIIKYRNYVASKYNSNSLDKKEIVYDNYYELIQMNQALKRLLDPEKAPEGLGIIAGEPEKIDIDGVLEDLDGFVRGECAKFTGDFKEIIKNLSIEEEQKDGE